MKILYVDISLSGHRVKYMNALAKENESVLLIPERCESFSEKQYVMTSGYDQKRTLTNYWKWIQEIKRIVKTERIDVVHILCGDVLYRFFGLFLKSIPAKVVVTYHHMLFTKVRVLSMKRIFAASYGVVHTDSLLAGLRKCGIRNSSKIEYPVFMHEVTITKDEAKKKIGLPMNKPCIVIMGGTQRYKGLDILLEALNEVTVPFTLYITGVEREFNREYILEHSKKYADSTVLHLVRLSEEEYAEAIAAADLLVLPYRFEFDGASGPMIDGVWNRKYVVGSDHGSMGTIIKKHHLGETFKTEDPEDLARVLNTVLPDIPAWSDEAECFRNELTEGKFTENYRILYRALTSNGRE